MNTEYIMAISSSKYKPYWSKLSNIWTNCNIANFVLVCWCVQN